jgi:hypothetical protein
MKEAEASAMAHRGHNTAVAVRGCGLLTGWGPGLHSLPDSAHAVSQGQRLLPVATPTLGRERLRRATRECLLAVAAVEAALEDSALGHDALAGPRTALVFASASAYVAANWKFLTEGTERALHFPYTAPSAVPGEVTIEFGITGPYMTLLSGANASLEALWQAATLLATAQCERAIVLGVETFQECAELYTTGRWLLGTPLVEAAACLILEGHRSLAQVHYSARSGAQGLRQLLEEAPTHEVAGVYLCTATAQASHRAVPCLRERWPDVPLKLVYERCGMCLACAPLIALMLAGTATQTGDVLFLSRWWDDWSMLRWPGASSQARYEREEGRRV